MNANAQTLSDRLARNPRTVGAPEYCRNLEAQELLDRIANHEAMGASVEDSQLEEWVEDALGRLEIDASMAAEYNRLAHIEDPTS